MMGHRYQLLDLIRVIAITLLLVGHILSAIGYAYVFGIPCFYYVTLAGFAVTIFLVLSGCVLELNYNTKDIVFARFISKRILRIYPVYYLSLFVGLAVYLMKGYYQTGVMPVFVPNGVIVDLVGTITGFYAFLGHWGGPYVVTSWFIGLIMVMYWVYPSLSWCMKRRSHLTIIILLGISIMSRVIIGKTQLLPNDPLEWFPSCRIFEFGLGIYLVRVLKPALWKVVNVRTNAATFLGFISDLSFPLFLVHYPLLFIIKYLMQIGFHGAVCVFVYLVISIFVSWLILLVDRRIPRNVFVIKKP